MPWHCSGTWDHHARQRTLISSPCCRAQNEAEFARRQDEIGELERQRLAAEAIKESAKEEQFYLKQNIDRARKRLDEDRAHAIDLLVQVVHLQRSHPLHDPATQPHAIFSEFRAEEIRPLMEEVELFQVSHHPCPCYQMCTRCLLASTNPRLCKPSASRTPQALDVEPRDHKEFWDNVMALLRMQLDDQAALASGQAPEAENGAVKGPAADLVEQALQGSLEDLRELQGAVQSEVEDSNCKDPEYWRTISHRCVAVIAILATCWPDPNSLKR